MPHYHLWARDKSGKRELRIAGKAWRDRGGAWRWAKRNHPGARAARCDDPNCDELPHYRQRKGGAK